MSKLNKKTYLKGEGSKQMRYETQLKEKASAASEAEARQRNAASAAFECNLATLTRKNTGESPARYATSLEVPTPIYNMGVTVSDPRLQFDQLTFPRKLDNQKMIMTDKGQLPVLHSVPFDEFGIAAHDWITFSFCQSTLGDAYYSINPDDVESELTYGIETFLDHHLYEIFGFGLSVKREKGLHNYKFAYELEDMLGMVLYGHSSKRISVQINGTGCSLARKGWQQRLYDWLTSFRMEVLEDGSNKTFGCVKPKITRVDLCHDDFDGKYLSVDIADLWDNVDGFWCGGRAPLIQKLGSWKRPSGKGRTFTVGDRTSGKYCRIYERGKKEGDKSSLWVRAEVEIKSKDRYIPLDILLQPSKYFIGSYPCFEWLARQLQQDFITPEKTQVVKKQSKINWDRAIEIVQDQFGKYIRQFSKIIEPNELVQMLSSKKDEVPKRLEFSHKAVIAAIRTNEPIKQIHDEFPLFVGVPFLNQYECKEFLNGI